MRKIILFMMVSLDGYFEGPNHDLSWHNVDKEFNSFAASNLNQSGVILFGRRTYEMMADFWPNYTPNKDDKGDVAVAEKMNSVPKVVFSRTLKNVKWSREWDNITLVNGNVAHEIMKLKMQPGKDIAVFGSNNLCVSLLELGLLDEAQIMLNPVSIGNGTPLFYGAKGKFHFNLLKTKTFKSGNILLTYQAKKN